MVKNGIQGRLNSAESEGLLSELMRRPWSHRTDKMGTSLEATQSAAPMPSGHQGTSISATLEPSRTSQVTAEGTGDRGDVEERARSHKDRFPQVPEDAPRDSALQVMPWRASLVEPSREEHQPGAAVTNPRPDLRSPESVGVHTHESRMEELMAAMLANLQTLGARVNSLEEARTSSSGGSGQYSLGRAEFGSFGREQLITNFSKWRWN